jgi:iron uptake system component EfeO
VDLVTGSVELLNEVSAGKITGEEDRYSHTDLHDIHANVEGSEAAFEELKPKVAGEDLTLANDVEEGFDRVYERLEQYRKGEGWVSYEKLDEADRRALSQKVDALAEPLSRLGRVLELDPVDLVTGSVELLNEVSAGKITGEEDRYSHTDLHDIHANVEGSEAAFEELKPKVAGEDLTLANDVEEGFDRVYERLEQYRKGEGWVSYEKLDEADRRALSQKVDALAEPLSRLGRVLEG